MRIFTIRRFFIFLFALALAAAAGWWHWGGSLSEEPAWRTAPLQTGSIVSVVTATGRLAATVQVSVGTQVSGQLAEVHADFNQAVAQGDLLARIDPQTFEYRLRQAEADLAAARAQVAVQEASRLSRQAELRRSEVQAREAQRELERRTDLYRQSFISEAELDSVRVRAELANEDVRTAQAQLAVAEAQRRNAEALVVQREAAWRSAQVDLARTEIRAPVDGVVISREVSPGQTVAASLQAPELFVIAQDLQDMQVEVSIDESDVGRVQPGLPASFTVDAWPGERFVGELTQVRKAAQNVSNVITYTAIIATRNADLRLVPGMTASVRIEAERRDGVLRVPNAALRFRPPGEAPMRSGGARIYVLDERGALQSIAVQTGLTDGAFTEVQGDGLAEGMSVVVGVQNGRAASTAQGALRMPF